MLESPNVAEFAKKVAKYARIAAQHTCRDSFLMGNCSLKETTEYCL